MTPRHADTAQPLPLCVPRVSQLAGTFSLILGTCVLAGWWFGVTRVAQPIPALPAMVPNTAVWFVLLGTSALLLRSRNIAWPRLWLAKALVLVVIWHSGTTLAEHLLSHDLGVDEILIPIRAQRARSRGCIVHARRGAPDARLQARDANRPAGNPRGRRGARRAACGGRLRLRRDVALRVSRSSPHWYGAPHDSRVAAAQRGRPLPASRASPDESSH